MRFKSFVRTCSKGSGENCENYLLNGVFKENPSEKEHSCFAETNANRALFAVSSGAESEAAGEEAAYIFSELLSDFTRVDFETESKGVFAFANNKIADRVFRNNGKRNAAEAAVLSFDGDHARVYCIGDAVDVFVCDGLTVKKLSAKPSASVSVSYDEFDENGKLKVETVTRPTADMLGVPAEKFEIVPYVSESVKVSKDTEFLLCSRAVTENVGNAELERILMSSRRSCEEKANFLVDIACKNSSGGCFTAEIVHCCGRGIDFGSGTFKTLLVCVAAILIACGLFAVRDTVADRVGSWFEGFKTVHTDQGVENEKSEWTPIAGNEAENEEQPLFDEQTALEAEGDGQSAQPFDVPDNSAATVKSENSGRVERTANSVKKPSQSTTPKEEAQSSAQVDSKSENVESGEDESEIYNGADAENDVGLKDNKVELPIDFGD